MMRVGCRAVFAHHQLADADLQVLEVDAVVEGVATGQPVSRSATNTEVPAARLDVPFPTSSSDAPGSAAGHQASASTGPTARAQRGGRRWLRSCAGPNARSVGCRLRRRVGECRPTLVAHRGDAFDRDARVDRQPVTVEIRPTQRAQLGTTRPGDSGDPKGQTRCGIERLPRCDHGAHVVGRQR